MNVFKAVREFWEIGHPSKIADKPELPTADTENLCLKLIHEERLELLAAVDADDLVEIADALGDLIYVTIGMGLAYGLPMEEVFAEIQRTNMAKFPDGKVVRDKLSGKIMKPHGWEPPDIRAIIDKAIRRANGQGTE